MSNRRKSPFRRAKCPVTFGFTSRGMIQPVYCGQWSCTRCRKYLARDWAIRARSHVNIHDGHVWYFWTFTMRGTIKTKEYAYKRLPVLWERVRKFMQRHVGKSGKWEYLAFVEGQPKRDHMPHFHVISSEKCPVRIKDFAVRRGFGHQATQEEVDGDAAAYYVTKYVSKGDADMPHGFRRCRPSQGWTKLPVSLARVLIVPTKGEKLYEFLVRVSDATGITISAVYSKWSKANQLDNNDDD